MSDHEAKIFSLGWLLLFGQGYVYAPYIPVVDGVDDIVPEEREHTPEERQQFLRELALIS
jgi:hypothetical protein